MERSPYEIELAEADKAGVRIVEASHGSEQDTNTEWTAS